jgi:hypothetical protein
MRIPFAALLLTFAACERVDFHANAVRAVIETELALTNQGHLTEARSLIHPVALAAIIAEAGSSAPRPVQATGVYRLLEVLKMNESEAEVRFVLESRPTSTEATAHYVALSKGRHILRRDTLGAWKIFSSFTDSVELLEGPAPE